MDTLNLAKNKNNKEDEIKIDQENKFQAYVCPNAGSNSNMSSKRQRVIFIEINRNDVYSVLDIGKVADIVLMVMSSKMVDEQHFKNDPDQYAGAIDE